MPNRIIYESIRTSDDYAKLSYFERDLFIKLIVSVDDFGIFEARPAILKGQLSPLDSCTLKQIETALAKMERLGIIILYHGADGRPYLQLTGWSRHQTQRATKTKYEMPPEGFANNCKQLQAIANNCKQLQANVSVNENVNVNDNDNEIENKIKKHQYGEYKNVLLTDDELDKLKAEYADWADRIERLSGYIAAKGDQYKSHYAVIRNWARKDKAQTKPGSFDTDDFFDAAVKNAGDLAKELRRKFENE